MRSLIKVCRDLNLLLPLRELSRLLLPGQTCYLVGGAIRDSFLNRPCNDFDFTTPFDPTQLAQTFAHHLSGNWFFLDQERRQSRVVIHGDDGNICCDFSPFRATSLTSDLLLRDFRVNAMALRVHADMVAADFIDPSSGLNDLRCGHLSICSDAVLQQDPLRILKGLRHCKTLSLSPVNDTFFKMREAASRLPGVAAERVKKELGLLLDDESVTGALDLLLRSGAAAMLFESLGARGLGAEILRIVHGYEDRLVGLVRGQHGEFVRLAMRHNFEESFTRQAALNLTVILKSLSSKAAQNAISALKLARSTTRALNGYLYLSADCLYQAKKLSTGSRGRRWWASGLGPDPLGSLLYLACSDWCQTSGDMECILDLALDFVSAGYPKDFIDGRWVCDNLDLKAGPLVGEAIRSVRQEEIAGRILSAEQAKRFLLVKYEKTH